MVDPAHLHVDESYQSPVDRQWVTQLAKEWDPHLYQPILVSERSDSSLWVIDGRHRLEAIRSLGIADEIQCRVLRGLLRSEEAQLFVLVNTRLQRKSAQALFHARLAFGDSAARAIADEVLRAGYGLNLHQSPRGAVGSIGCVVTLDAMYAHGGRDHIARVLALVRDAWRGRPCATEGRTLRVVDAFATLHEYDTAHFTRRFAGVDPADMLRDGARIAAGLYGPYSAMVQIYNSRLASARRLAVVPMAVFASALRERRAANRQRRTASTEGS